MNTTMVDGTRVCMEHGPDEMVTYRNGKTLCRLCRNEEARRNKAERAARGHRSMGTKSHCAQGHPYSGDNLEWGYDGTRLCRTCHQNANRSWQDKVNPDRWRRDSGVCKNAGHPYGDNPRRRADGSRICPTCWTATARRSRDSRRAKARSTQDVKP